MPRPLTSLEWLVWSLVFAAPSVAVAYVIAWWLAEPGSWGLGDHAKVVAAVVGGSAAIAFVLLRVAHGRAEDRFVAGHLDRQFEHYLAEPEEPAAEAAPADDDARDEEH